MTNLAKKELPQHEHFFQELLSEFSKKFVAPSLEISGTRCISKTLLSKHLLAIRDTVEFPGYKRISAKDIRLHLERAKVISPIKTLDPNTGEVQNKFYLLGFSTNEGFVEPIELLQALEPRGIVCYFTALEYYGLTTQIPSHHHVAKLAKSPLNEPKKSIPKTSEIEEKRSFDILGNKKFIYEGITYYLTNRSEKFVPGTKERYLNEKTRFRITTLEQTLLDTLHKPLSCGGAPIVFEAWENASTEAKSETFLTYLKKIDSAALACRAGYMMEIMHYTVSEQLSDFLNSAKKSAKSGDSNIIPSLLPGIEYHNVSSNWPIRVP